MAERQDLTKQDCPEWIQLVVRLFQAILDWNFFRYGKKGRVLK